MQSKKKLKSPILTCKGVSKRFGEIEVFSDLGFSVFKGEKVGLVGANGSGKTTLLKLIVGLLEKDDGLIVLGKGTTVEYLPQIHKQAALSGGEAAKKVLAPMMASGADLFLLDEPTNNLDEEGLGAIESFVKESDKAFIIVSHDRTFLDKTVGKIVELDPLTHSLFVYEGNYSTYLEDKEVRIERQWKEYSGKMEKMSKYKQSIEERSSWIKVLENKRKGIKHLPIHERGKPDAAYLRDKEARMGRRTRIMKDRLERFAEKTEGVEKPIHLLPLKIIFEHERGSTRVFELEEVVKKMGAKMIGPLNLSIRYGERWHITGQNGAGKTTLIKMLVNDLKPDSGRLEIGQDVRIGYVPQDRWARNSNETVIKEFLETTESDQTDARKLLNRFRITTEDVDKNVGEISPGERSRLIIAELVARKPNCIILDEPSNHLDLEVLEELEDGLSTYKGTLIVVSHDRYFVEKLKLDRYLNYKINPDKI